MFGAYRLLLACLVALSHFGLVVAGFNPGQWAVLSFYVLSGYLMEHQFHKLATTAAFYQDRFLRVYPLYAAVLLFAAWLFHPSAGTLLINATLLPLNYSLFTGAPILVGPAWSLACELHFYLLVPLLVRSSTRTIRLLASGSGLLFALSPFLPGSTFLAYIGLPGILFAFLSGILIARHDFLSLRVGWIWFAVLLALFVYSKFTHSRLLTGIHINVCLGYLAAVPTVIALGRLNPKVGWDRRLGLLSYPLFLVHEPLKEFIVRFRPDTAKALLLACAVAAATLLVLVVEKPFDRIRYRARKSPASKV